MKCYAKEHYEESDLEIRKRHGWHPFINPGMLTFQHEMTNFVSRWMDPARG